MEILRLSLDFTTLSDAKVQQILDQMLDAGIPPLPDGHCAKRHCSGVVRRRSYAAGKDTSYLLSPYCPMCNTRYRQTPLEIWLPLEVIS